MITGFQIILVIILIGLGAFFSGSETGVYRLSRFRLRLGIEQKRRGYFILGKIMEDTHGLVFAILIGNNLVNYLASSAVTVLLLNTYFKNHVELYATVFMTPVLFTFSEVIPKNILYYRSDSIMPRLGPVLWFFYKVFTFSGVIALFKLISRPFTKLFGTTSEASTALTVSRGGQIRQIIRETSEEGILSDVQNGIINRLFNIPDIAIGSVMTTASRTQTINVNSNKKAVFKKLEKCPYTRICVYEKRQSNIIGFIRIYDVLAADKNFSDLRKFVVPIKRFAASMPVIEAMNVMRKDNLKIILVVEKVSAGQAKRKYLGIVTMKDLVEELTGELSQW